MKADRQQFKDILTGIIDSASDMIAAIDPGFRYIAFNDAYRNEYRSLYGEDIYAGASVADMLARFPEDRQQLIHYFDRALQGQAVSVTEAYGDPGRSRKYFESRFSPVRSPEGTIIGAAVICRDVTDRVKTETALRESEEKYRNIVETAEEGIWYVDAGGLTVFVNPRMAEMLGYTVEAMTGSPVYDYMYEEDKPVAKANFSVDLRGISQKLDFRFKKRDETSLWVIIATHPLLDENGTYKGSLAMITDITGRKQAENDLRKLTRVVEESPAIVVITDVTGRIEYVNPQFTETTGYTLDEVSGKNPRIFKSGYTAPEEYKRLWETILSGETWRGTFYNKKKSGDLYWESAIISPLVDNAGRITGFMALKEDITQRKRAEDALKEAKAQAELYVDLMGHDINNMNYAAMGYLELALQTLETEKKLKLSDRAFIERPMRIIENSSALIANVRKLQQLMAEGIKTTPTDLEKVFAELDSGGFHSNGRDVRINIRHIPGAIVEANELLKDIFVNLVSNAIKHSDEEKPLTVNIQAVAVYEKGQKYYRCIVEDNGPGVPDNMKRKLFNRFQRGTTKAHGKWLGLYLVRTLVEGYGGKVSVEDRVPGDHSGGARFVVMLQAAD